MKNLFLTIACIAALHSQAQLFTEAAAAFALPSFRPAVAITPGIRMADVELTTPAMWWPAWAANAGATVLYRFPGSYTVGSTDDGLLIGAGYGYTWHSSKAKANGAANSGGIILSIKKSIPSSFNRPMIGELRYQGRIVSLAIGVRL